MRTHVSEFRHTSGKSFIKIADRGFVHDLAKALNLVPSILSPPFVDPERRDAPSFPKCLNYMKRRNIKASLHLFTICPFNLLLQYKLLAH